MSLGIGGRLFAAAIVLALLPPVIVVGMVIGAGFVLREAGKVVWSVMKGEGDA